MDDADMAQLRAGAGAGGGCLILRDGRRIAVERIVMVGDERITFVRPGSRHAQSIVASEVLEWQADAGWSSAGDPPTADPGAAP